MSRLTIAILMSIVLLFVLALLKEKLITSKKTIFTYIGIGVGVLVYGMTIFFIYSGGHVWNEINPPLGIKKAYERGVLRDGRIVSEKLFYASGPVVKVSRNTIEIMVRKFTNIKVVLDEEMTRYFAMSPEEAAFSSIQKGDVVGLIYGNFQGKEVAYEIWTE